MALEKELAHFKSILPSLSQDEGRYVLVRDSSLVGVYSAYEDALKAGFEKFGPHTPFLVKRISTIEQPQHISRFVPIV